MDINYIKKIFMQFDTSGNGTLSKDELKAAKLNTVFTKETSYEDFSKSDYIKGLSVELSNSRTNEEAKNNDVFVKEDYCPYREGGRPIIQPESLDEIPKNMLSHRDVRNYDISKLDISAQDLLKMTIDKTTILSDEQRKIISETFEKDKDPGLGIRNLHSQGITGKGLKIAIVDQGLGKHKEYSDRVINYEEVGNESNPNWNNSASMHAAAVTSIAAGKEVGVVPEADIVFISAINYSANSSEVDNEKKYLKEQINNPSISERQKIFYKEALDRVEADGGAVINKNFADAINKILDKNKDLPENEKIPVISISWGFNREASDYKLVQDAIDRAKNENVFVISTALDEHYGMDFNGANRDPEGNFDSSESYHAGAFWEQYSETASKEVKDKRILVPMDQRTVADYTDNVSFRHEGDEGGMSWATPWLAGVYVLAKQVKPSVTPEEFFSTAIKTSDDCKNRNGAYVGRIINPEKLIAELKSKE